MCLGFLLPFFYDTDNVISLVDLLVVFQCSEEVTGEHLYSKVGLDEAPGLDERTLHIAICAVYSAEAK